MLNVLLNNSRCPVEIFFCYLSMLFFLSQMENFSYMSKYIEITTEMTDYFHTGNDW